MSSGWTISQMESGFIASPEYYAQAGSTDAGWVTKLYTDVLGRPAGAGEGRQRPLLGVVVAAISQPGEVGRPRTRAG